MRPISALLLAAQKIATGIPYPKVEIRQRIGAAIRLYFLPAYNAVEPDDYNAATSPGDGSLIRVRINPWTIPKTLFRQRVTDPNLDSDFTVWHYVANCGYSGTALASYDNYVILFWTDIDQKTIKYKESADYGASWGGTQTLLTATNILYHLAAAMKSNGDVALFYFEWNTIKAVKRLSGSWGSPAAWTNTLDIVSGIAAAYHSDWNLAISGRTATDQRGVWTCIYGDEGDVPAGTWSALKDVLLSDNTNIEYKQPALAFDGERHRLSFIEVHAADEEYHRPYLSFNLDSFIDNLWREPYPFYFPGQPLTPNYTLSIAIAPTKVFLSNTYSVSIAERFPPSIEVTKDLLDIQQSILPIADAPIGRMSVELDNTSGQYANFDRQGCELLFSPGYFTTAGPEASAGPSFWIESWDYISRPAKSSIIIHAVDAASLLSSWRVRRQLTWGAGTMSVKQLIRHILARVGIPLQFQASSTLIDDLHPAFTIQPGQTGLHALKSLLAMVSDVLFFRESTAWLTTPNGYFGYPYFLPAIPTQHPIWEGRYSHAAQTINWVQVWGTSTPSIMVDRFNWSQLEYFYDRLHQVHNANINSLDLADQLCYALLTEAHRESIDGDISVPPNCAGELWDYITVTDDRVGFDYVPYRVRAIETHYNAQKATYSQKLFLHAYVGGGI